MLLLVNKFLNLHAFNLYKLNLFFAAISPCAISEGRRNISSSQLQRRNRDHEQIHIWIWTNKCENGWLNFSASFWVVALKLATLIRFTLSNHWIFFKYLTCHCSLSDVIMSYHFLALCACTIIKFYIIFGYRKCKTRARVFSQTLAFGNSKNKTRQVYDGTKSRKREKYREYKKVPTVEIHHRPTIPQESAGTTK